MTFNTVSEQRSGLTTPSTKAIIKKARSTARASTFGQMARCMTETGTKTE
jgi:hypothetical protein